jgi:Ca2+-binding EF-hand superfamily protein
MRQQEPVVAVAEERMLRSPVSDQRVVARTVVATPVAGVQTSGAIAATARALAKFKRKKVKKRTDLAPLPEGIDRNIPGIHNAWDWFHSMDADDSGVLDVEEVIELLNWLGLHSMSRRKMRQVYVEMRPVTKGRGEGVNFQSFASWWSRHQAVARREMRRTVKELFQKADCDRSGILDQAEFAALVIAANSDTSLPRIAMAAKTASQGSFRDSAYSVNRSGVKLPTGAKNGLGAAMPGGFFDLEQNWAEIRKIRFANGKLGVNFSAFENWWKEKTGMNDPDIPVLPESMVMRITDKVKAERAWDSVLSSRGAGGYIGGKKLSKNWQTLRAKLHALVRMRSQWGDLHSLYETRSESLFEEIKLGKWIRNPESGFSMGWDSVLSLLLLYVVVVVPLRTCFGVNTQLWSFGFWFDAVVDVYFLLDVR